MLFDETRHEPLLPIAWDEVRVRNTISHIVRDTEARFSHDAYWPVHPLDLDAGDDPTQPAYPLYHGAGGVFWALHYLQALGASELSRSYFDELATLLLRNRAWLRSFDSRDDASYLMGETPILMMSYGERPTDETPDRLAELIAANLDHPARELMWGSPGTLLAALFLHRRSGEERWAQLFRTTAARLWSQLQWSGEFACHYWTQDLYGQSASYLDAVHGFVATAAPLIGGRHLLAADVWSAWQSCIVNTVERTATREHDLANWRPMLYAPDGRATRWLMQFCHGAPGFVCCLAELPDDALDPLLLAAGEAIWSAGPLTKGSNLCHGTGGNGYAFLKLYQRTGDTQWLQRARAFAMHGIAQTESDAGRYGQLRYSLWTGDLGFAIYLWDCLRCGAAFPTLDMFYADPTGAW